MAEDERAAATRRVQQINVAYALVRDPQRRAEYERLRRRRGADYDALVVAAGRWAGHWWARHRRQLRRSAELVREQAAQGGVAGRRLVTDTVGRIVWLLLCAVGLATGWLASMGAQRLLGVDGPWAQLGGVVGGLLVGNQRGWQLRRRLARLAGSAALWPALAGAVALLAVGLWLDAQ